MPDKKKTAEVIQVITNNASSLSKGTFLLIPQGFSRRLHTVLTIYISRSSTEYTSEWNEHYNIFASQRGICFSDVILCMGDTCSTEVTLWLCIWKVLVSTFSRDKGYLDNILTWHPKSRIIKSEKTLTARQRHGKHIHAATNMQAKTE
jgi:hypothetical protein